MISHEKYVESTMVDNEMVELHDLPYQNPRLTKMFYKGYVNKIDEEHKEPHG